jgi:Serine dehydrogenase proteinase
LILNSPGGDPYAAQKIVQIYRNRFKSFEVIVPKYAKSAATMIVIGSDNIFMGPSAVLGSIDPQIRIPGPKGRFETISARAILHHHKNKIHPEVKKICENALNATQEFAIKYLSRYMLAQDPVKARNAAEKLSNGIFSKSHSKGIKFEELKEKIGLKVNLIEEKILWPKIRDLYVSGAKFLQYTKQTKLFENEKISIATKPKNLKLYNVQKQLLNLKTS